MYVITHIPAYMGMLYTPTSTINNRLLTDTKSMHRYGITLTDVTHTLRTGNKKL